MYTGNVLISTVYVSPGLTPYSVTLVLLVVIGDWSVLTLCFITYPTRTSLLVNFAIIQSQYSTTCMPPLYKPSNEQKLLKLSLRKSQVKMNDQNL